MGSTIARAGIKDFNKIKGILSKMGFTNIHEANYDTDRCEIGFELPDKWKCNFSPMAPLHGEGQEAQLVIKDEAGSKRVLAVWTFSDSGSSELGTEVIIYKKDGSKAHEFSGGGSADNSIRIAAMSKLTRNAGGPPPKGVPVL